MCLFYYCNSALVECKLYKGLQIIYNKYWGSTSYTCNTYWGVQILWRTYCVLHRAALFVWQNFRPVQGSSRETSPLSSPGTTSYSFHVETIGLSLTAFAVLRMFRTDGQNWSSKRQHYALKYTGSPPKSTHELTLSFARLKNTSRQHSGTNDIIVYSPAEILSGIGCILLAQLLSWFTINLLTKFPQNWTCIGIFSEI